MSAFPSGAFNINVVNSGLTSAGNTVGRIGTMPPKTGMPIMYMNHPVSPPRYIQRIDPDTGLLTVAVSGASGDQLFYRSYPWEVSIWAQDAVGYAWPTGAGCITRYHTTPGATGNPGRATEMTPGGTFIYG